MAARNATSAASGVTSPVIAPRVVPTAVLPVARAATEVVAEDTVAARVAMEVPARLLATPAVVSGT